MAVLVISCNFARCKKNELLCYWDYKMLRLSLVQE